MNADWKINRRRSQALGLLLAAGLVCSTSVAMQAAAPPPSSKTSVGDATASERDSAIRSSEGESSDAEKIEQLRRTTPWGAQGQADGVLGGIGSLAVHPRWRSILPLGEEQSATLIELDNLVREGRAIALQEAADHPAEDYASYKSYVDRIQARQSQAIGHARRIVEIGLLTESQRNLIDLRNEWSDFEWLSLKSGRAQDLLDLTKDQRRKLEDVYEEFSAREGTWEIWNPNDQVRQEARLARSAFRDRIEAKAREILTPEQAERWSKFVAERTLPAEPPELPACSDANSKLVSIQVTEDSPIFRVLKKHPPSYLGITPYQKRLVDDLAEVTQNGLLWIELERCRHKADDAESENSGAAAKKKSGELMHAAEQVALVGVLSPQQAERIEKLAQEEED